MKTLLLGTAAAAALAMPAAAQNTSTFLDAQAEHSFRASDFIGARIYASETEYTEASTEGAQADWEDIGEINDVMLTREGDIDAVLLDIGGFLGIGERQVAIDMDAIKFVSEDGTPDNDQDYFLVVNAQRQMLEEAPEFQYDTAATAYGDSDTSMEDTNTAAVDEADQPITDDMSDTDMTADADAETALPGETETDMAADADANAVVPGTAETDMAADAEMTDPAVPQTDMAEMESPVAGDPLEGNEATMVDAGTFTAEELTGKRVYDGTDEDIGEISNVVLTSSGTVDQVIIDVGGFLGIGEKSVALSTDELNFTREADSENVTVSVNMTKEELEQLPTYED